MNPQLDVGVRIRAQEFPDPCHHLVAAGARPLCLDLPAVIRLYKPAARDVRLSYSEVSVLLDPPQRDGSMLSARWSN
jgi:hypothetical protein